MSYVASVLPTWSSALSLVKEYGYERRDEPFVLASGRESHDYIDGKYVLHNGEQLRILSMAVIELARDHEMEFTHVGGLTMGADALAHGIAVVAGASWFSVRKEPKTRGREQWIEGSRLGIGDKVLLVDDVVTTGGSILKAYERVVEAGATVIGVIPMVDRGEEACQKFAELGVPYAPLITYKELGIAPVGQC